MDAEPAVRIGHALADRHRAPADPETDVSLLDYAESAREDDWSMRSALVRFALPEPERAARLLELVRRLDTVLHHTRRHLEEHTVTCDRGLVGDVEELAALAAAPPVQPYADVRTTDLARVGRSAPDALGGVLGAYEESTPLTDDEHLAVGLLGVALLLDDLADVLAGWAVTAAGPPPAAEVDAVSAAVAARLDELAVPEEAGRPRGPGRARA